MDQAMLITVPRATTMISDLHDDLLADILCRLYSQDMLSCKCVSKLWKLLISEVCIPKISSLPTDGLIFNTLCYRNTRTTFCKYSFDRKGRWGIVSSCTKSSADHQPIDLREYLLYGKMPFRPSGDDFLDCCNGVFLFFRSWNMKYYVYNPSTLECITVHNSPCTYFPNLPRHERPSSAALFFDPHYKIVHISDLGHKMSIFSPITRKWSNYYLDYDLSTIGLYWSAHFVYLDGSLYKLSNGGYLLKFNVRQIGCETIKLPITIIDEDLPLGCIGVSEENLHYGWDDGKSNLNVWIFKDHGHRSNQWVLKYSISLQLFSQHPLFDSLHEWSSVQVMAFHPTSNKFFVGSFEGILCYDVDTEKLDIICVLSEGKYLYSKQELVYPFAVNLTSLRGFNQSIPKEPPVRASLP